MAFTQSMKNGGLSESMSSTGGSTKTSISSSTAKSRSPSGTRQVGFSCGRDLESAKLEGKQQRLLHKWEEPLAWDHIGIEDSCCFKTRRTP